MSDFKLQYKPFGERSILIEWPQIISRKTLKDVLLYKSKLQNYQFKEKVYVKHAYNSILITYSLSINNIYDEILLLKDIYLAKIDDVIFNSVLWKIPVCYNLEFGKDLEEISLKNNITISKIINLHSSAIYDVYFLGFLPGFLYLGGLDYRLHFPRKTSPRFKINKGSVAIGGTQTGVYPRESPGGWNIIGRTPLNFFDISQETPCFAKAGDKIEFVPIEKSDFDNIKAQVENGHYTIESEIIND